MTVAQLITRLQKVKDKNMTVACETTGAEIVGAVTDYVDLSKEKRLWLKTANVVGYY